MLGTRRAIATLSGSVGTMQLAKARFPRISWKQCGQNQYEKHYEHRTISTSLSICVSVDCPFAKGWSGCGPWKDEYKWKARCGIFEGRCCTQQYIDKKAQAEQVIPKCLCCCRRLCLASGEPRSTISLSRVTTPSIASSEADTCLYTSTKCVAPISPGNERAKLAGIGKQCNIMVLY